KLPREFIAAEHLYRRSLDPSNRAFPQAARRTADRAGRRRAILSLFSQMAPLQSGRAFSITPARGNSIPMAEKARRKAAQPTGTFAAHGVDPSGLSFVRGLYRSCRLRRRPQRTYRRRPGRARSLYVFGRIVVAMPSENHLRLSAATRMAGRSHPARRQIAP